MSNNDAIKNSVKDTVDNARDAANELKHRTSAELERAKRDTLGDEMTLGEKAKSGANELKNRAQAEIDKAKREVRAKK
jgi:hypothetical protein